MVSLAPPAFVPASSSKLEGWLKADPKKILEGTYRPLAVVKKA